VCRRAKLYAYVVVKINCVFVRAGEGAGEKGRCLDSSDKGRGDELWCNIAESTILICLKKFVRHLAYLSSKLSSSVGDGRVTLGIYELVFPLCHFLSINFVQSLAVADKNEEERQI
jgi:hypothetical protein